MSPIRSTRAPAPSFRRAVGDEQKDQRRSQILSAAKRVFSSRGYHDATIGEVAKAARVSYGSVYWYFDSKEALLQALMEHEEAEFREHVAGVIARAGADGEALFRAAVKATLEFFEADSAAVKLLFRDSIGLGDRTERRLYSIYEGFVGDIESMIVAAQEAGEIVAAPPRVIAFSVAALISQLAMRRLVTDDGIDAGDLADFVVSLVLDGLRPR